MSRWRLGTGTSRSQRAKPSHPSSYASANSSNSGLIKTFTEPMRTRPLSFRVNMVFTVVRIFLGSILAFRRQKSKLAERQLPTAAANTRIALGPLP